MLTKSQQLAFTKFSKLKVGALFMEMGTGKTRTALELINFNKKNIDLVLWFTPCSTKKNLQKEIKKWNFNQELLIFGWETLSQSDQQYLQLLELIDNKNVFIVADESLFIKNGDSKRYKRLLNISKKSKYKLLLNGTPITRNEWDLYYQMQFLSPLIFNMSEKEFQNNFFDKITYKKKHSKVKEFFKLSEANIEYLHKLIEPYIFKVDFNFDKEVEEKILFVETSKETRDNYEKFKRNSLEKLADLDSETIILLLQNLLMQSALDDNKNKEIAKFIKDRKVIVFCNFIKEIEGIKKHLKNYLVISGSIAQKERNQILEMFKDNDIPLIMTFGTGSFGLNMQFCNEIIFSSLTFDYAKILQAKGRIKRLGQENKIKYTTFECNLPINKFIGKNISKKKNLKELLIKELKNEKCL